MPTAGFSFGVTGLDVAFADTSTDSDGSITAWSWDFGDSTSSNVQHPSHSYAAGGTYTVVLTITDNDSGVDSVSQLVAVSTGGGNEPPVASFSYVCNALDCSFDSSVSYDDVGIDYYSWTFGDGNSSTLDNPSHIYPTNGVVVVSLVITDAESESDTATAVLRVKRRGTSSGSSDGDDGGGGGGGKEKGAMKCSDGMDNDGDGLSDGDDPDCE